MPDAMKVLRDPDTPKETKALILGAAETMLRYHMERCRDMACETCPSAQILLELGDREGSTDATD